jgi:hypothetical protein
MNLSTQHQLEILQIGDKVQNYYICPGIINLHKMVSISKKLCSLLFLFLIVFNTIGNYALLFLVKQQLSSQILQRIECNADELSGNLVLTFPITLPYSTDSEEYTRIDGEISYGGEVYQLVKQKIYQNVLYLVCIKDNKGKWANEVIEKFAESTSGQQQEQSKSGILLFGSMAKYFVLTVLSSREHNDGWCRTLKHIPLSESYSYSGSNSIFHPPS